MRAGMGRVFFENGVKDGGRGCSQCEYNSLRLLNKVKMGESEVRNPGSVFLP